MVYVCICVHAKSLQSCVILCDPMGCSPPGFSVHGILQQEYWSGLLCAPPGDPPNSGIKPRSPALQADSLLSVPPGKSNKKYNNNFKKFEIL